MNLSSVVRSLAVLGFDAVEAAYYMVCDFNRAADEIWNDAGANALADKEAELEVAEPKAGGSGSESSSWASFTYSVGQTKQYGPRPRISTSSPASGSVGDEPPSRSAPPTGVEREGLQLTALNAKDITDAAYAIWRHAETREGSLRESWYELAERFDNAAKAME